MNFKDYLKAEEEIESLHEMLEQSQSESEAEGILRKIHILEIRVAKYLDEETYSQKEEEEY